MAAGGVGKVGEAQRRGMVAGVRAEGMAAGMRMLAGARDGAAISAWVMR